MKDVSTNNLYIVFYKHDLSKDSLQETWEVNS